jgi:CxxC motif-containing protein (DUF1111 family)
MRILAAALAISAIAAASGAFAAGELDAVLGKALFERDWVPAPASTDAADGLGPLFAARSCSGCHAGEALAGRFTAAPNGRIAGRGFVLRFGDEAGRPDPVYGRMLQTQAVQGMTPEGRLVLLASDEAERGYDVSLVLERGGLDPRTQQSPRLAPPIVGRAVLERIDPEGVLALADPDDWDGDGISGRARLIEEAAGKSLGRYGWKAATASLEEQVADAFAMDMGLSSALRPRPHGDCTARQTDCLNAPTGESDRLGGHELSDEMVGVVTAYLNSLPARSKPAGDSAGFALFASAGCSTCHQPSLPDADGNAVAAYTDLLLHDMGPGLDDGVGEPGVASAEWRTAPLIAMRPGDGRRYLHDGRAGSIDAAIRAHGGEAEAARSRYVALSDAERNALVAFVEAL